MQIAHFLNVSAALEQLDRGSLKRLRELVRATKGAIWLCGNGGSFAVCQHWECDFVKAADRAACVLSSGAPLLTALANDDGYATVFATEVQQWAKPGDTLVCLSCSGTSENIALALAAAKEGSVTSILLTGTVSNDLPHADHIVRVWSKDYAVIEDVFAIIGHWLTKELAQ